MAKKAQIKVMIMPSATVPNCHIFQAYYGKEHLCTKVNRDMDMGTLQAFTRGVEILSDRGVQAFVKKPFIERRGDAGKELYSQEIDV